MMRSLYSGVAGLQNHQVRMDVLGNNIANVNTTGFKKGRVNFQDLLYQQMSGASRPNAEVGGVNPKEIGLGMSIASVDTIHTQGALQTTGVMTDVAVQGNGFFVLKKGEQTMFTRAGAFGLDRDGRLVNPGSGLRVQGWLAQNINGREVLSTSGQLEDLVIPVGSKDPAKATSRVELACNLDKRTPEIPEGAGQDTVEEGTWRVEEKVYDSFGEAHILRIEFRKAPGETNRWNATTTVDPGSETPTNAAVALGEPVAGNANAFTVEFDNRGLLRRVADAQGGLSPEEGALDIGVSFDVLGAAAGADGAPTRQTFRLALGRVGSATGTVTQQAERSSTKVFAQDGYTMGYLDSFKIDQQGIVTAVYSNGSNRTIGQMALASFTNPNGLEKIGETNFVQSNNSGMANVGPSGIAGKGKLIAGTLEMSNVDLAEQFTDMIVTQRGFQANSKTIQTSDQMLQELLTLKR
ncbi:MAG TPA: flagellar hook protein FlgE [Spirochaetia bacterium]|nr:flagellar hook protein FlgE [Spirochaetales bacterium]HRY72347.1 flagellar hook protein FlgE [Spirochaetia bacterium]